MDRVHPHPPPAPSGALRLARSLPDLRLRRRLEPQRARALRTVVTVFVAFQLAVWTIAIYAPLKEHARAPHNDPLALTHPFGHAGNVVFSPLARYDATFYMTIAYAGYGPAHQGRTRRMAFFPLYPMLVSGVSKVGGGGKGAVLLAGYAVAAVCLFAALYLLYRLVELELGRDLARPTLLLMAFFPTAFFFAAPFSESLFLLLSVGALYAARTGRWAWAGAAAAAASATRLAGLALLVPLAIMYLWGPRGDRPAAEDGADGRGNGARGPENGADGRTLGAHSAAAGAGVRGIAARGPAAAGLVARLRPAHPLRWNVLWLGLAPLGIVAFIAYLGLRYGHPLAFSEAQRRSWGHVFVGPLSGAWQGATMAARGAHTIVSGHHWTGRGQPVDHIARFGYLVFWVVAAVGVARRLPPAYVAYVLVSLAIPLSVPTPSDPLGALNRYLLVVFPVFMWLALLCERRRATPYVLAGSAVLLGFFTAQHALWHFVA